MLSQLANPADCAFLDSTRLQWVPAHQLISTRTRPWTVRCINLTPPGSPRCAYDPPRDSPNSVPRSHPLFHFFISIQLSTLVIILRHAIYCGSVTRMSLWCPKGVSLSSHMDLCLSCVVDPSVIPQIQTGTDSRQPALGPLPTKQQNFFFLLRPEFVVCDKGCRLRGVSLDNLRPLHGRY